jgi:hypothetical protein
MAWSNYGRKGWHVDHIFPLAMANLEDPAELRAAINWRNCRPMWGVENLEKKATVSSDARLLFDSLVSRFRSGSEKEATVDFEIESIINEE